LLDDLSREKKQLVSLVRRPAVSAMTYGQPPRATGYDVAAKLDLAPFTGVQPGRDRRGFNSVLDDRSTSHGRAYPAARRGAQ
jgi:hypothetical protein